MLILDTDHVSLLEWGSGSDYDRLQIRLQRTLATEITTTIVSYEEQTRGWLAYLARARKLTQQVEAFRRLHRHLNVYREMVVLDFDEAAAIEYQNLQHLRTRIGTCDVRIAAIALAQKATLLTRNTIHFQQVPGLQFADWTIPPT
ncbi:MAG: type II toxin-antitoxin system VapC family toxin [Pirellulaceae bacterium]